ncbi:IclR family transcriptional regulator [Xylophilus sp.]|uniref:IclR family transcriptional regulator n=1 Tax=Xylophilus sp. TaxID=2653893 RepID=UPI0013BC516E|nr:helix-turn-helix domain-containing protein [Xylophilus sp.]KAF1042805.1 MAG: Transcriptional repressor IclR [Xylophilus sp.]
MPRKAQTASVADADAAPGGAAAVDRALSLLAAFRPGDRALPLAELAGRARLYKSTALRLLASLEHGAFVVRQDDGRYALGPAIARLHGIYAAASSLEDTVMPVLRALVERTGESAAFHVRRDQPGGGWVRLCLLRVDSPQLLRDHVRAGDLLPADRGAGARVLQAFGPQTDSAPPQDAELLAQVRAQGWCALIGDRTPELAGISAPVLRSDGSLAGALTLTMPTQRYAEEPIAAVVEAARSLGPLLRG